MSATTLVLVIAVCQLVALVSVVVSMACVVVALRHLRQELERR